MLDVLIAGAGPAGAVAAIVLARAGVRVAAFDRARFPRDKLCGDTVNPGAVAVLERLGLGAALAGALPIDGIVVTGEGGVRVEGRYGLARGRALTRRVLDAALVDAARASGAVVDEGVLVRGPLFDSGGRVGGLRVRAPSGRAMDVAARIVIAADGRYSRVARPLGLSRSAGHPRRWAIGAYFEHVAGLTACGEMHVRRHWYLGVAPLPGGLANAVIVTADRQMLRRGPRLLQEALQTDRALAPRFAAARRASTVVTLGPLAVDVGPAGVPGLLLAGDAAGFIDPMTGDGLRFAFRGGELAARHALLALQHGGGDAHLALARDRSREFAWKWRFNRLLRALVGSAGFVRLAAPGAALTPGCVRAAIRYAGDVPAGARVGA